MRYTGDGTMKAEQVKCSFNLPERLHKELRIRAALERRTITEVLIEALELWVESQEKEGSAA